MTSHASDMNTTDKPNDYVEALQLAEAGKTEQALAYMQEFLASAPNDAEALNDTGAILFSLGHTQEALNHLNKARLLEPDSAEIVWNLVETSLAGNDGRSAMQCFDDMERIGILNPDVLNRTADVLLKNEDFEGAQKTLQRSLEIAPAQEIIKNMIEIIQHKVTDCNG